MSYSTALAVALGGGRPREITKRTNLRHRNGWMLRGAPQSNAEKVQRGYAEVRRLSPEETAKIAAEMGLPVSRRGSRD
jgi:hypothetical protein